MPHVPQNKKPQFSLVIRQRDKSTQMDFLDFIRSLMEDGMLGKYQSRVLYKMYKEYHGDDELSMLTENKFCRMLQKVYGVIRKRTTFGTIYWMDKAKIQQYLDNPPKKTESKRKHNAEQVDSRKQQDEQEGECRKLMVEYAHGDALTRLTLDPTLHRKMEETYGTRFEDEQVRSDFIKSLALAVIKPPAEYAGVYVLRLGGLPHTHYVGRSETVLERIEQHKKGAGAACTAGATSIEVVPLLTYPVKEGEEADLDGWERAETLTLMYSIGIDKVRGWHYVERELSDEDRRSIHQNICSRNGLCLRCGFGSHMVTTQCFARYRALWMGGGAF
jgi:predicted GIY-YIG superfamily endonuclease